MTSSRRRVWLPALVSVLAVVLVLGGYSLYWQQVAVRLQNGVDQWVAEQRSAGATIDFHWNGISGFPFAFTADFTAVNILGRLGGTALSARTDHLQLNMSPINLQRIRLLCDSPLTVIIPGLSLGQPANGDNAPSAGTRFTLDQADGSIRLQKGSLAGATLDVNRGKLDNGQDVLSAASLHLDIQLPETPPHDFKDPAAMIDIAVGGVEMPADMPQLLPGPITQASLTGTIKGPLLPPPGTATPPRLADLLAQWRDAGGVFDLSKVDFAQGPVALTGNGTLSLDKELQPEGAGTITATGLGDLIDLLTARGAIHHKDAGIAKAVINGLQKPGNNGRPEVTVGLTIQDRVVNFGFARLFKLAPIVWP